MLITTSRTIYLLNHSESAQGIPAVQRKSIGRVFLSGAGIFAIGFLIWNLDNIFCSTITKWKQAVGWPAAFFLEASPEPARKRQRLSSPTYDEYFPITQEELHAFDEADRMLSRALPHRASQHRRLPSEEPLDEGTYTLEAADLGGDGAGDDDKDRLRSHDWSSSPPLESAHEDRAAEDRFFAPSSQPMAGFKSAASISSNAVHAPFKPPGFFPATNLSHTSKETTLPPGNGFAPATSLSTTVMVHSPPEHVRTEPGPMKSKGFGLASAIFAAAEEDRLPSPPPPRPEYDSWFDNDASVLPPSAAATTTTLTQWQDHSASQASTVGFKSASAMMVGFGSAAALTGGKSKWTAPSAEALARAEMKRKQWDVDDEKDEAENVQVEPPTSFKAPVPTPAASRTPARPVLRSMENRRGTQMPETPLAKKTLGPVSVLGGLNAKNKPFKSPLVSRPISAARLPPRPASALKPVRIHTENAMASSSRLPAAFPTVAPVTPTRPASTGFGSPPKGKVLGMTPRRPGGLSGAVKKFLTPFKPGMAPGEDGRVQLEQSQRVRSQATPSVNARPKSVSSPVKAKAKQQYTLFNLAPRQGRRTLADCGLRPETFEEEELEIMGIDVEELRKMSPANAVYYCFHSASPMGTPSGSSSISQLGHEAAYAHLRERGCTLASPEWVKNHYGLILWKLAGMVCLEPEHEQDPSTRRWCWSEVMRQLLYRYERELLGGSRPALRLISTEDAPSTCPMILCVSAIVRRGLRPEIEVTDGWYCLRAQLDQPLARALERGRIRVGCKLATSGAKLCGDRKEAREILETYDHASLELYGNSTHLAPWHAKMGFVKEPFVATLDSLTADGGNISVMDLIVDKVYPVAFLEFVKNDDGSTTKLGPRDERGETKARDEWLNNRDKEISKIREGLEKQLDKMEKVAHRLTSLAGSRFSSGDHMPDHIEDLFTEMMEDCERPSQMFPRLSPEDASWLRRHALEQLERAREHLHDDIENELRHVCPERNVRDFRVLVVRDARWEKREPTRTAQITLWDAMRMVFADGGAPGDVRAGQRFLVTNLQPNQPRAWMRRGEEGAVVYLVSKKNTTWTTIKGRKT
ncbi:uncharacterized protein BXZ73DRAFT_89984 [Epithele typhae]|uniref:uncharacterized protein n=1 Tax=Epithele typhae TaxID=378194 RepID=UPI002007ACF0|nr:uncharacterized protein BXZ73DRAFT_89984 [Epithele typhae]KAH9932032.1 hypothetical protein BXZ73DRAFT_89984 [Epithele typhae]